MGSYFPKNCYTTNMGFCILRASDILAAAEYPEPSITLGQSMCIVKSGLHLEARNATKYIGSIGSVAFRPKRCIATGIPWPDRGGGQKWIPPGGHSLAWLRPASAGGKRIPAKWESFFCLFREIFLSSREMDSY